MIELPLKQQDVNAFWELPHRDQIKMLEALAGAAFKNWCYTRPVIAIGRGEHLFDYFLEKLLRRCPSVVGLFDPHYGGKEPAPYHSFQSVITPGLPTHHVRIYKDFSELEALNKAYDRLLFVDFSQTGPAQSVKPALLQHGYEVVDFTFYEMVMNRIAVYEHWHDYRAKTAANLARFLKLESRLEDAVSKRTLLGHLGFVFSGDRNFLRHDALGLDSVYTVFRPDGFSGEDIIVDAGATNGDSVTHFTEKAARGTPRFICFEPDAANFQKLKILQEQMPDNRLTLHQAALGAETGEAKFSAEGTVSSHLSKIADTNPGAIDVPVVRLDDLVETCTFIKMDVEGAEPDILKGARRLFARCRPEAALCVYHFALDLVECADLIDDMRLGYKLNLRRHLPYIYELILYANPI
jgi:FkbM family methyltransferase